VTNVRSRAWATFAQDGALVAATLATCLLFLSLTGVSLLTLDRIKYTIRSANGPITPDLLWHLLRPSDFALPLIAALSSLTIVVMEWRDRAFSRLISGQSPLCLALVSIAALIWFGHAILAPGLIITGDAGTHVARVNHLALAIQDGSSLYWDNYFFGGSTLLQFTGPLFHWMAAAVQLVVGDPTQAVKYTAFAARMVAAAFMYGFARRIGLTRPAAAITMLFYAGSYFFTYMEIIRSSFPQLVNFAAMPAILYFAEGMLVAPLAFGPASVGLALSATAFVACHQPTAAIFALFAAAYVVSRLTMMGWPRTAVLGFLVAAAASALSSVYFLVPFALERSITADDFPAGSLVLLARPSMTMLRNLAVWGRTGLGAEYSTYFGLPMLLCAIAGVALIATRGNRAIVRLFLLCLALAVATLFVRGAYVRYATLTFFFLCAASGAGLQMLLSAFPRASWLPAAVFILFVLDAGPAAIQPWTREDVRFVERAGQQLAIAVPDQRVMEITFEDGKPVVSVDPMLTPLTEARVQILSGPHKQDATPAHNGFTAMLKTAEDDLRNGKRLTSTTMAMLAAVNVGWGIAPGEHDMGLPDQFEGTQLDPLFGRSIRIADATPFLVSNQLEVAERPASFAVAPFWNSSFDHKTPEAEDAKRAVADIARRMNIDLTERRADRFLVPRIPDGTEWSDAGGAPPHVTLADYQVKPDGVHLVVEADRGGFIRLAHPLTPNTRVTRNGVIVSAIPDVEALTVLPLIPGTNDITLVWIPSRLRQICFWTSMIVPWLLLASLPGMRLARRARARRERV
jgi:hypothetical protein